MAGKRRTFRIDRGRCVTRSAGRAKRRPASRGCSLLNAHSRPPLEMQRPEPVAVSEHSTEPKSVDGSHPGKASAAPNHAPRLHPVNQRGPLEEAAKFPARGG